MPQLEFSSHEEFDQYIYKLYKLLDILQGPFWRCKHCKTYVGKSLTGAGYLIHIITNHQ